MINLNQINNNVVQIYDSFYKGMAISGSAVRVKLNGAYSWQYYITIMAPPRMITIESNEKDGTIWNTDMLIERIKKTCDELLEQYKSERGANHG